MFTVVTLGHYKTVRVQAKRAAARYLLAATLARPLNYYGMSTSLDIRPLRAECVQRFFEECGTLEAERFLKLLKEVRCRVKDGRLSFVGDSPIARACLARHTRQFLERLYTKALQEGAPLSIDGVDLTADRLPTFEAAIQLYMVRSSMNRWRSVRMLARELDIPQKSLRDVPDFCARYDRKREPTTDDEYSEEKARITRIISERTDPLEIVLLKEYAASLRPPHIQRFDHNLGECLRVGVQGAASFLTAGLVPPPSAPQFV